MRTWLGQVTVTLKPSVNDPQGLAVLDGLHNLGFSEVQQVRIGKHIDVKLEAENAEQANSRLLKMCETLLANTLIETYEVQVEALEEVVA